MHVIPIYGKMQTKIEPKKYFVLTCSLYMARLFSH